jgi:hypothetical protein
MRGGPVNILFERGCGDRWTNYERWRFPREACGIRRSPRSVRPDKLRPRAWRGRGPNSRPGARHSPGIRGLFLVEGRRCLGIVVGVVVRDAAEGAAALGVSIGSG